MKIKYKVYNPAGNITALVIGENYSLEQRKLINDAIMKKELNVEQVGFLSIKKRKLTMAGGEFCGNATRCAALYYMKKQKNVQLEINNQKVKCGIDKEKNVWCEIPIEKYKIIQIDKEIYGIKLRGITIVIIRKFEKYENLKQVSKQLIEYYKLDDDAVGVMYVEKLEKYIKIYPIVWVKEIDTLFFENACGSGSIAVSMLESLLKRKSNNYIINQPSGEFLKTEITFENNKITKAILKGKIEKVEKIQEIII